MTSSLPHCAPATPGRARPQRWRLPAIGLIAVAVAGGSWGLLQAQEKAQDKSKGQPKDQPAAAAATGGARQGAPNSAVYELAGADVAAIEAGELAVKLPLSGSLIPQAQATVKSKVSGVVVGATVAEGLAVAAGQVIATIDSAEQQARAAQMRATLDEARARLSLAGKNNANSGALLKQNFISQHAYDTAQNSVELAQAGVDAAKAQLDLARIALADTVIRAPLAGLIAKRHVQTGEKVAPDMPVATIVDLRQLTLEAQVPAADITRIKVGQEVRFHVDGYGQRNFVGAVARINPGTEAGSRALLVYISVANPDRLLRAGMFAKGSITTEKSAAAPLVPLAALRQENKATVVYAIVDGKVVAQPLSLGLRNEDDGYAEVTGGLAPGARVLVSKLDGVKPGDKVKLAGAAPVPAASPARAAAKKG